jgi:hypothetical protein
MLSQNSTPALCEDASFALVVAAANGDRDRLLSLLASGLADPMIGGGLPLLVAAASGQVVVKTLVSDGAYRKHPEILRMASRLAFANQCLSDGSYLSEWAGIFESWIRDGI